MLTRAPSANRPRRAAADRVEHWAGERDLLRDTVLTEAFERLGGWANDLGLFAEEVDLARGEQIGNFPQAFSHVGLINAAWRLSRVRAETTLARPKVAPWPT